MLFTAPYPRFVRSFLFCASWIPVLVLIIALVIAPLVRVVDPRRVIVNTKLLVTAVIFALCEALLLENSMMSPTLN